jgi:predicted nuclease of predicted toxin-antitoxin system
MILLFDQNISFRVSRKLHPQFPNCKHISDEGLLNSSDVSIWDFCKKNIYCIVTFDHDFIDLSLLKGAPPKVIFIKTGNLKSDEIIRLFIKHKIQIEEFLQAEFEASIIEIG